MITLIIVLLHLVVIALVGGYLLGFRSGYNQGFDNGHDAGWSACGGPELPPLDPAITSTPEPSFEEEVEALMHTYTTARP